MAELKWCERVVSAASCCRAVRLASCESFFSFFFVVSSRNRFRPWESRSYNTRRSYQRVSHAIWFVMPVLVLPSSACDGKPVSTGISWDLPSHPHERAPVRDRRWVSSCHSRPVLWAHRSDIICTGQSFDSYFAAARPQKARTPRDWRHCEQSGGPGLIEGWPAPSFLLLATKATATQPQQASHHALLRAPRTRHIPQLPPSERGHLSGRVSQLPRCRRPFQRMGGPEPVASLPPKAQKRRPASSAPPRLPTPLPSPKGKRRRSRLRHIKMRELSRQKKRERKRPSILRRLAPV